MSTHRAVHPMGARYDKGSGKGDVEAPDMGGRHSTRNIHSHRATNERDRRQLTTDERWTTLQTVGPAELD
jgi:hypothetical protein